MGRFTQKHVIFKNPDHIRHVKFPSLGARASLLAFPASSLYMLIAKQYEGVMPKGPQGQKRPADTGANAIRVAKVLTGEIVEQTDADDGKDKAAQALGRKGGAARAKALTPEKRREIAQKAAAKRWKE